MLPNRSLAEEIWYYALAGVSIILYILVLHTLIRKQKKNYPKSHLFYLILGKTAVLMQGIEIAFWEVGILLPYLAIYFHGFTIELGIPTSFFLPIWVFNWYLLASTTSVFLISRYTLLSAGKVGSYTISKKRINTLFISLYAFAPPGMIFLYKANLPKDVVALEYPGQGDLLYPNLFLADLLSPFSLTAASCLALCYFSALILIAFSIYGIFSLLNGDTSYSAKTKMLHKRAVNSALFMVVPAIVNTIIAVAIGGVCVELKLFFNIEFSSYQEISQLIISMMLLNSSLVSLNTLFQTSRDNLQKDSIKVKQDQQVTVKRCKVFEKS